MRAPFFFVFSIYLRQIHFTLVVTRRVTFVYVLGSIPNFHIFIQLVPFHIKILCQCYFIFIFLFTNFVVANKLNVVVSCHTTNVCFLGSIPNFLIPSCQCHGKILCQCHVPFFFTFFFCYQKLAHLNGKFLRYCCLCHVFLIFSNIRFMSF